MNDVSVEHICSLYDYCYSAESFLNDIESVTQQIIDNLDILLAESNIYINKIQDVLEHYKSECRQIYIEIDGLSDQLKETDDYDIRMEVKYELRNKKEELAELKEGYFLCRNDYHNAKELYNVIITQISTINRLTEEYKIKIKEDTDSSISFIKRYVSYLQDIKSNI